MDEKEIGSAISNTQEFADHTKRIYNIEQGLDEFADQVEQYIKNLEDKIGSGDPKKKNEDEDH